ncbi:hypothetical protein D3C75_829990 [compost metagenome]
MAALGDAQTGLVDECRAIEIQIQRALGQVAQHVEFGQCSGGVLQRRQGIDQGVDQGVVQQLFPCQCAALRRQRLVLECLELGGDEALGPLERLAADIVGRRLLGLDPWQLDVVAVDAVVANLEIG